VSGPREAWRSVRAQRSSPPALAGEFEDRRRVFQAALTQAEELWDAAAVGGPASRPLPLFYSVSQATQAVCSAWTTDVEWRPTVHGLSRRVSDDPAPERRVFDYAARVSPSVRGSFSMVAAATRSATFTGHASVAELWASLPGWPTPRDMLGDVPRCLPIEAVQLPGDERPLFARVAVPLYCVIRSTPVDVPQLPATYPTMVRMEQAGTRANVFGGVEPVYRFPREDGSPRPLHEVGERPFYAEGLSSDLVVRPRIGTGTDARLSEFLTLWALLWCLSELARYYPDTWVAALDPDRSPAAVTLERGLDIALEQTPRLIGEALGGPISALVQHELERRRQAASAVIDDEGEAAEPEEDQLPD
jgi:hypothetical protein